ncbi:PAS domain-containing protein [Tenacibaculum sp. MEBiC06402]|uniref:PAS domain-containing protein n=1 Tax=unclassified Tenacibaculum TaxID=2635139 RepID=UPI003B9B5D83
MKNPLHKMRSLDIFINSLAVKDYQEIKGHLYSSEPNHINFLSFDLHIQNLNSVFQKTTLNRDLLSLKSYAGNKKWKDDLDSILLKKSFEALILTDLNRNILWVNDGFSKMTGYSKDYAMHKSPSFLQGRETSEETRTRIKTKLKSNKPFTEIIINHRKDNTTYKCELHIFPLKENNQTTHFLALERQIA